MADRTSRFVEELYTDDAAAIEEENREEANEARMHAVANRDVAAHAMASHPALGRRLARVADMYEEIAKLLEEEADHVS